MPARITGISSLTDTIRELRSLQREIAACSLCPRLVEYRQEVARRKPRRFRDWNYWARPLPGFGDPCARLLVLGLAPAAHGGNRTGRMFTGDRSGSWLISTLYRFGFANQPSSESQEDGLELRDAYITASIRCAPPRNRPLPAEIAACRSYLLRELRLLKSIRVIVALGRIAFDCALAATAEAYQLPPPNPPRPTFGHGKCYLLPPGLALLASFHPSQQNTLTGRLTQPMFDAIFVKARQFIQTGDMT